MHFKQMAVFKIPLVLNEGIGVIDFTIGATLLINLLQKPTNIVTGKQKQDSCIISHLYVSKSGTS